MEQWKPFLTSWEISNMGRIRNKKSHQILKFYRTNGYCTVSRKIEGKSKTFRVHRLVANAFLPPPLPEQTQVCHNNNDPTDNRAENLRWDTASGNMRDLATANNRVTIQPLMVETEKEILFFPSIQALCRHTGRCLGTVWGALRNYEINGSLWKGMHLKRITMKEYLEATEL